MRLALFGMLATLLVGYASAQAIEIGFPANGTTAAAGSTITVEIERPDSLSPVSIEVALVIAVNPCGGPCHNPPGDALGTILFNGPWDPQFQTSPPFGPLQNFTLELPATLPAGPAQLAVFHVALIGLGPEPFVEIDNITLIIS